MNIIDMSISERRKALRDLIAEREVDMGAWMRNEEGHPVSIHNISYGDYGTSACLAGWARTLIPDNVLAEYSYDEGAIADFFGLILGSFSTIDDAVEWWPSVMIETYVETESEKEAVLAYLDSLIEGEQLGPDAEVEQ